MLGYASGTVQKVSSKFPADSMQVGQCLEDQDLNFCNGGGNGWGNLAYSKGQCKQGKSGRATVTCSDKRAEPTSFTATMGAKNGVSARSYTFRRVQTQSRSGSYSTAMITECKKWNMQPVCDHPSYCKNDGSALYIGQSGHIAYNPHRKIASYFPLSWSKILSNWNGVCSYTSKANGNNALCNIPTNTHAWRKPSQTASSHQFVCGKVTQAKAFTASLKAKNGVAAHAYTFQVTTTSGRSGSFSNVMKQACSRLDMKPVCDHRNYCKNDAGALYIGQQHHLAYHPHRYNNNYMPGGFASIRSNWDGVCSYTANANGNYALCNIPTNTHAWKTAAQGPRVFVCGSVNKRDVTATFTSSLGARSGVSAHQYLFQMVKPSSATGKYSDVRPRDRFSPVRTVNVSCAV